MVPEVVEDILLAQEPSCWIRIFFSAAPTRIATIGKIKLVIIHPVRSNARKKFLFTYRKLTTTTTWDITLTPVGQYR